MSTTSAPALRPDQTLADRFTALDALVDASVVPYSRSPGDWCQLASGCTRPAELTLSSKDSFTGRPWEPTMYCAECGLWLVAWLLRDDGRTIADLPSLIGVEVWRVAA